MKSLSNRFDTDKDFVSAMIAETDRNYLPDYMFEQACEEFEILEDSGMRLMIESKDYYFTRAEKGWYIVTRMQ
ncbi:MAG TPA: hypothetical protein VK172_10270 [Lentimicrobium sp.]|nr:hypothetical protein [Lentimicrobium sp.]